MPGAQLPQAPVLVGRLFDIADQLAYGKITVGKALEELRKVQSQFDPQSAATCAPLPYIPPTTEFASPHPAPAQTSVMIEVNW